MASNIGLEFWYDRFTAHVEGEINDCINTINTEHNDGFSIDNIDAAAFFQVDLNINKVNYDPFVFFEFLVDEAEENTIYGHHSQILSVSASILFRRKLYNDSDLRKKAVFRYREALSRAVTRSISQMPSNNATFTTTASPDLTPDNNAFSVVTGTVEFLVTVN